MAIDAQLNAGHESTAGFQDFFSKMIGSASEKFAPHNKILKASGFDTRLGSMIVISDETGLCLLEFIDRCGLERDIERLQLKTKKNIIPGGTDAIESIKIELELYFSGKIKEFKTPIHLLGSPFQKLAWEGLMRIPYGVTQSYMEQAASIGKHQAYRAVANANGANQLAIIIPCHRIIHRNGNIGGYSGGIDRKQWLIEHEKMHA